MLKQLVEAKLGHSVSDELYKDAKRYANIKLRSIIDNFGTAEGERLQPYYLVSLIVETVQFKNLQRYFDADDIPTVVTARHMWDEPTTERSLP